MPAWCWGNTEFRNNSRDASQTLKNPRDVYKTSSCPKVKNSSAITHYARRYTSSYFPEWCNAGTFLLHSYEKIVDDENALQPGVEIREDHNLVKITKRYTGDVAGNAHAVNEWVTLSSLIPTIVKFAGIAQEYLRGIKE